MVIDRMHGGGGERVCLDLSRNLIQKGFIVDLVICEFQSNSIYRIPHEVNLFVLLEENPREYGSDQSSVQNERINWIVPTNSIKYSSHFKHVVSNWPFGIKIKTSKKHKRIIPTRSDLRTRLAHAFSVYLRENRPNLVIANLPHSVFCTLVARDICEISVPVICSIHSSQGNFIPTDRNKVNSRLLHKADWVHTVSKGIKKELLELNWVNDKKITTIYNSVDKQRVIKLARLPSGHPWLDHKVRFNHKVIMTVGRLDRKKNHPLLIRSFAKFARSGNFKLIILGEGHRRNNLQSLIVELGLAHIISMPGWVANPFPFMRQSDVFVLSSNNEGFGLVLVEALMCGCSIVSTDCPQGGPREILDDGNYGELVPVDDENAMAEAIAKSLHSNRDRKALKARAEEFSPERQVAEFEQMFNQVLVSHAQ